METLTLVKYERLGSITSSLWMTITKLDPIAEMSLKRGLRLGGLYPIRNLGFQKEGQKEAVFYYQPPQI